MCVKHKPYDQNQHLDIQDTDTEEEKTLILVNNY